MNMDVVLKQKMGLTWNMVLWQQNGDFIYGLHLSMAIATPNLKFIPCVEAEIPGRVTAMFTYEELLHTPLFVSK